MFNYTSNFKQFVKSFLSKWKSLNNKTQLFFILSLINAQYNKSLKKVFIKIIKNKFFFNIKSKWYTWMYLNNLFESLCKCVQVKKKALMVEQF